LTNPQQEFEKKLQERQKKKNSKLEDNSFIDWELVFDFIASALFHIFFISLLWALLVSCCGDSYYKKITKYNTKKIKDIVFRLVPGKAQKGEIDYKETKKLYGLK